MAEFKGMYVMPLAAKYEALAAIQRVQDEQLNFMELCGEQDFDAPEFDSTVYEGGLVYAHVEWATLENARLLLTGEATV